MTPPIIVDIEASGFGKGSYPIEVGYISRHAHPWCALIMPSAEWTHWDSSAEKLHHISRDVLLAKGKDPVEIARHLNDVFHHQTVYTDGWLQDFTWMNQLFNLAGISPLFKLEDLRSILSPYQQSVWHETKQSILNDLQLSRHRASADAQILQLTWLKTAEQEKLLNESNKAEAPSHSLGIF